MHRPNGAAHTDIRVISSLFTVAPPSSLGWSTHRNESGGGLLGALQRKFPPPGQTCCRAGSVDTAHTTQAQQRVNIRFSGGISPCLTVQDRIIVRGARRAWAKCRSLSRLSGPWECVWSDTSGEVTEMKALTVGDRTFGSAAGMPTLNRHQKFMQGLAPERARHVRPGRVTAVP